MFNFTSFHAVDIILINLFYTRCFVLILIFNFYDILIYIIPMIFLWIDVALCNWKILNLFRTTFSSFLYGRFDIISIFNFHFILIHKSSNRWSKQSLIFIFFYMKIIPRCLFLKNISRYASWNVQFFKKTINKS